MINAIFIIHMIDISYFIVNAYTLIVCYMHLNTKC